VRGVDPNWKKVRQQHDKRKLAAQEIKQHVLGRKQITFLESITFFWGELVS